MRVPRNEIPKIILQIVAVAGLLSVAVLAPNAIQMLKMFGFHKHRYKTNYIDSRLTKLTREGYIQIKERADKKYLQITDSGKLLLRELERKFPKVNKQKWDKKWRMVVFDISEKNKYKRDLLRERLKLFGFRRLQNSVWVNPYDCEDFVLLLKTEFQLGYKVLYITAEKIEGETRLIKLFNLS